MGTGSDGVTGSAFDVAIVPGAGYLEKVHGRALLWELAPRGVSAKGQISFPVCYKGQYVGKFVADLVIEEKLIVELKCADGFARAKGRSSEPKPTAAHVGRPNSNHGPAGH